MNETEKFENDLDDTYRKLYSEMTSLPDWDTIDKKQKAIRRARLWAKVYKHKIDERRIKNRLKNRQHKKSWIKKCREEYESNTRDSLPKAADKEYIRVRGRKYYQDNIEKLREYNRKRRLKNKENNKEQFKDRKKHYKYLYDITIEQLNEKILTQNKLCDLCKKPLELIDMNTRNRSTALDHNHTTKMIRGVIHRNCNALLGLCYESVDILELAIDYLYRWNGYR